MATQPLAAAKFREFDANGAPLAGGKLYTYAAGTTTPLATYTDSTGNTANANPVILDSAGRADVWLTGGSLYKLVLQDSAGNLQYTEDNFQVAGTGNAQLAQPNTFTAANTFTPAATNTTAVTATGNGTGAGAVLTGGTSSGPGATVTGGAPNGNGLSVQGVGTGSGLIATGGPSNGVGAVLSGVGTGAGITATGGASSGHGGVFQGGGPNGIGVWGTGAGTSPGLRATKGTGFALEVQDGHAVYTGANPAAGTAFSNTVTPKNIIKAWGRISTDGAGHATLLDGFNVSSIAISSGSVLVTLATPMANTNYVILGTGHNSQAAVVGGAASGTTQVVVYAYSNAFGPSVNLGAVAAELSFMVLGAQ